MSVLYENETILLGLTMKYPRQAASIALPYVTHDKFIHNRKGIFGGLDHQTIWQHIVLLSGAGEIPYVGNVIRSVGDTELGPYMRSLVDRIEGFYKMYEFDAESFKHVCKLVDKAGVAYRNMIADQRESAPVNDPDNFEDFVLNKMPDADEWLTSKMTRLGDTVKTGSDGYKHVSEVHALAERRWDDLQSGHKSLLLDTGITPITKGLLTPLGMYAVFYGYPSSGKSAIVHQMALGAAINLYLRGVQGCAAINSLEMNELVLYDRFAALLSGYNTREFFGGPNNLMNNEEFERFKKWGRVIADLPLYIDDTNLLTTSAMKYRAQGLHTSTVGPIWFLCSDFMEMFMDSEDDNKSENLRIITYRHKDIARMTGAYVAAVSQVTPGADGSYNKSRIVGPMATRGSRAIYHSADIMVEVLNYIYFLDANIDFVVPEGLSTDGIWLLVEKNRHGSMGRHKLGWLPEYTRVYEPDDVSQSPFSTMEDLSKHFTEILETQQVTKSRIIDPADTTLGGF